MIVRRKWTAKQKFSVVIQGLKGKPVVDICNDYGITQSLYYKWCDKFLNNAHNIFELDNKNSKEIRLARENNKLKQCLAEATLELKKTEEGL